MNDSEAALGTKALHLVGLTLLAVAQPLFDLLGRNPEFFVAHGSRPADLIVLVALLCLLAPGALIGFEGLTARVAPNLLESLHGVLIAGLAILALLPMIKRIPGLDAPGILLLAAVGGVTLALTSSRVELVQSGLSLLGVLSMAIPVLFLFFSPARRIVFPPATEAAWELGPRIESETPIVLVVFDEFLATSIMNREREIDSLRYPSLAALARRSTWYRNTSTVAVQTMTAVPAILTGRYPEGQRLPRASEYRESLFSLLGGSYEIIAFESVTKLCADELCSHSSAEGTAAARLEQLLVDIGPVYAHLVLPDELTRRLPNVTTAWKGFQQRGTRVPDAASLFRRFLDSIDSTEQTRLYFVHSLLPHIPWQYLPSGKRYGPRSSSNFPHGLGRKEWETWSTDEWHVEQGLQRYLLQVGFVDRLIGELVAKLEATGMFDEALIVITADHGVSFLAGDKRRPVTDANYADILPVPLFIKAPHQVEGKISDRDALTIDILPTIADLLGLEMPWRVDGVSLLGSPRKPGGPKAAYRAEGRMRLEFPDPSEKKYDTLERILRVFGDGRDPGGLYRIGPFTELLGRPVAELELGPRSERTVELYAPRITDPVDLDAVVLPVHVAGTLEPPPSDRLRLALAIDGVVRAVTRTYRESRTEEFRMMVPESALRPGELDVRFFVVEAGEGDPSPQLRPLEEKRRVTYALAEEDGEEVLRASDGQTIPIVGPNGLRGYLDFVRRGAGRLELVGWAADVAVSRLPVAIAVFADDELLHVGRTNVDRGAEGISEAIRWRGFAFNLSDEFLRRGATPRLRLFAVGEEGVAIELVYPEDYAWGG